VGVILGVDGGNSKTELVAATTDGAVLVQLRGPGSNSHGIGAEGTAAVIGALVEEAGVALPVEHGTFYLCGADLPPDIAELESAVAGAGWAGSITVDNDTFALLRAGSDAGDAVAVVCGSGINCVGRAAGGRIARAPSLGWESGDWGGSEMLGREALFLAARAEDGRGRPTGLVDLIRRHFELPAVVDVGAAVHYRRLSQARLGELAPIVLAAAAQGDAVARELADRLAGEVALMVRRAFRELGLEAADVVLGGGMFQGEATYLTGAVAARLPSGARPLVFAEPPVVGAALAALDAAGASEAAKRRLRSELARIDEEAVV
jgi:N-acetylglucosamine kinase-like BadF-type ATPase